MSAETNEVCCNCRYCIRSRDDKYDIIICRCALSGVYLSYASVMGSRCDQWRGADLTEDKDDA